MYEFRSFYNAVRFMADASALINGWDYHPRREGQSCAVKVWFRRGMPCHAAQP